MSSAPASHSVFDGLNDGQKRAVEHDGGPLIVLAGPGTGKTKVLTCRVAHLVLRRGVKPEQVVAVTYTVKAARQLRERLVGAIGPSAADRVHAHTFHGLGLRLLRRFGDVLGLPPVTLRERGLGAAGGGGSGGIIDSAQARRLLRDIILENRLFPHAAGLGVDSVIADVQRWLGAFASAGLSPAQCRAFCAGWAARLDAGAGPRGEALDAAALEAERERQRDYAHCCSAYEAFDRACRRLGFLSFDDLIGLPIRVLRESGRAAAIVRDEWRHLVVDEFQDVNAAQLELLRVLAPPDTRGPLGPDLTVVGDDDQSIYGFRGADDLAFRKFARIWNGAVTVPLTENYRSRAAIVHVSNTVIARATGRFAPDKVVEVARTNEAAEGASGEGGACGDGLVECVGLENDFQDGDLIAAMILADRAADPGRSLSEYAVLARNHSDLERVHQALRIEGIPSVASRAGSVLDDEGVQDVLAWVQLLVRPREAWHARRLLTRPPLSCPLASVNAREGQYRAELSRVQAGEPGSKDPGPYVDWLAARFDDDPAVARLKAWHDDLRGHAAGSAADEAMMRIVTLTGVAHADLLPARERSQRVANLVTLLRFARERQPRLDPPGSLADFWTYYQDLDGREQGLAELGGDERIDGGAGPDEGEETPAVRLITAHGAKGLEFDTVFVTRVSPQHGFGKSRVDEDLELPEGLVDRDGDSRSAKERAAAEERRLFYVACTRARRRLVLLSKKNKSRSKSAAHFFEEIVYEPACKDRVRVRDAAEVLREAAELGATRAGAGLRDEIEAHALAFRDEARARDVFARFRRECRVAAATALDAADRPASTQAELEAATRRLLDAASRLAIVAHVERTGKAPAWARAEANGLAEYAAALERAVDPAPAREGDPVPGVPTAKLSGPLPLSYTFIADYLACPRCFYVKHVLGLDEPEGTPEKVGQVVHAALQRYYTAFREADANGLPAPALEHLLEMGTAAFFQKWPRHAQVDRAQLEQVRAQLRLVFERLHEPGAHVLELERRVQFPYRCANGAAGPEGEHAFAATIDRIDQVRLPDGSVGFRIIDYKTGRPTGKKLEPQRKDLQLGIYALAAAHLLAPRGAGVEADPGALRGTAEYWMLATGERGVVDLGEIDHRGVREAIDAAVAGMLAGRFARAATCRGLCGILGPE